RAEDGEPFGEAFARAATIFRHPGQREPGLAPRLPERCLPVALLVVVDSLRIGEVRENLLRGLDDNIFALPALRHSVPHVEFARSPSGNLTRSGAAFVLRSMIGKSHSDDK